MMHANQEWVVRLSLGHVLFKEDSEHATARLERVRRRRAENLN